MIYGVGRVNTRHAPQICKLNNLFTPLGDGLREATRCTSCEHPRGASRNQLRGAAATSAMGLMWVLWRLPGTNCTKSVAGIHLNVSVGVGKGDGTAELDGALGRKDLDGQGTGVRLLAFAEGHISRYGPGIGDQGIVRV